MLRVEVVSCSAVAVLLRRERVLVSEHQGVESYVLAKAVQGVPDI